MGNRCPGREGQTNPTAVITQPVLEYIPDAPNTPWLEINYSISGSLSTPGSSPIVKYEWEVAAYDLTTAELPPKFEGVTYVVNIKKGQVIRARTKLIVTDQNGLCNETNGFLIFTGAP